MFPLWDNIPSQRFPFVNYAIVALCSAVFFIQLQAPQEGETLVREYGMIPIRISNPQERQMIVESEDSLGRIQRELIDIGSPVPPFITLVTCMFLHGGWMHLIGNMWFLFIFGDNVEDRFGHIGYCLMYLISGLAAGAMHVAVDPNSFVPTIGASGAIAGVMGAYLLLYPGAMVMALIPLGPLTRLVPIPAPVFLVIWFAFQIISGFQTEPGGGGVAWWAHVGGFISGFGMTAGLKQLGSLNPAPSPAVTIHPPPRNDFGARWR